jgi:hypothetical protein
MRALCCGLVLLLAGGCASSGNLPKRTWPKVVLGALVLGGAAVGIAAGVKGDNIEEELADDIRQREVSGREFASRDSDGERWNRIARASAFVSGLSLLALGILWEMSLADRAEAGLDRPPVQQGPIFPVPAAALKLPPPGAQRL